MKNVNKWLIYLLCISSQTCSFSYQTMTLTHWWLRNSLRKKFDIRLRISLYFILWLTTFVFIFNLLHFDADSHTFAILVFILIHNVHQLVFLFHPFQMLQITCLFSLVIFSVRFGVDRFKSHWLLLCSLFVLIYSFLIWTT